MYVHHIQKRVTIPYFDFFQLLDKFKKYWFNSFYYCTLHKTIKHRTTINLKDDVDT